MVINNTKTINYNAISAINVDGEDKHVMYMYGSINAEGLPSWNSNITDVPLYRANQAEVDADFETFKQEILDDLEDIDNNL